LRLPCYLCKKKKTDREINQWQTFSGKRGLQYQSAIGKGNKCGILRASCEPMGRYLIHCQCELALSGLVPSRCSQVPVAGAVTVTGYHNSPVISRSDRRSQVSVIATDLLPPYILPCQILASLYP
jgi:hypothetical protein